jgi:hypothetical protein
MISKEIIGTEKQVMLEILDGNSIQVSAIDCSVDTKANGVIKEVTFNGVISYKLNEKIAVDINGTKHSYDITKITKVSNTSFIILNTIPTKTKHFLLPTLGDFNDNFSVNSLLINCYLSPSKGSLILLYRFIAGTQFNLLDKYLRNSELFKESINASYTTIAYEMLIPFHYSKDIEIFLKGKYSELSDRLKKRILAFHKLNYMGETAKILYKNSEYRKQLSIDLGVELVEGAELHSIPLLSTEIYKGE